MTKTGRDSAKKAEHAQKMRVQKADEEARLKSEENEVLKELPVKVDDTMSPEMKAWLSKNNVDIKADPEFRKKYEQMLNADTVMENSVRAANYVHGDGNARKDLMMKSASEKGLISGAIMEDELNSTAMGHEMDMSRRNYNDILVNNIASRTKVEMDYEGNAYGTLGSGAVKNTNLVDKEGASSKAGNKKDMMKGADTGTGDKPGEDDASKVAFADSEWSKHDRQQKNVKSTVGAPSKKQGTGGKFTWDGGYRASRDVDGELNKYRASEASEASGAGSAPGSPTRKDKLSGVVLTTDDISPARTNSTKASDEDLLLAQKAKKGGGKGPIPYQYAYSDEVGATRPFKFILLSSFD